MRNSVLSVFTGIAIGFLGTCFGTILWILALSDFDIPTTLQNAWEQNLLGAILSAGSLPNIASMFLFLRQRKYPQAKGVVIATLVVAAFVIYLKFR